MRLTFPAFPKLAAYSVLGLALLGAACQRGNRDASTESLDVAASGHSLSYDGDFSGKGVALTAIPRAQRGEAAAAPPRAPMPAGPQSPVASSGMIIRNGEVSLQVDSVELAAEAVRRLAASLGGHIGNVSISGGEHRVRSATLEMKIPAARFDDALAGMAPIGKVEHSVSTAQDVGEEFVDVTARVANARRLEERLVSLLATRTGKLEDVLAVERELARVRGEIERFEGRIRYLSSRVATSTIVATVHERAPLVASHPGTNVIRRAFVNMWRNFVLFVASGIEALGVLIPVAALAWTLWALWRRRRRITATA